MYILYSVGYTQVTYTEYIYYKYLYLSLGALGQDN